MDTDTKPGADTKPHAKDKTSTRFLNKWIVPHAKLPTNMHTESESDDDNEEPPQDNTNNENPKLQNMSIIDKMEIEKKKEDETNTTNESTASTLS